MRGLLESGNSQASPIPGLGSGKPLESSTRNSMESAFGESFAGVRVHDDIHAAVSADFLQARAYTVGQNIAFARGEYSPQSPSGQKLLAHELTHVIQQSRASTLAIHRSPQLKMSDSFDGRKNMDSDIDIAIDNRSRAEVSPEEKTKSQRKLRNHLSRELGGKIRNLPHFEKHGS